jgi:hypothetical protein
MGAPLGEHLEAATQHQEKGQTVCPLGACPLVRFKFCLCLEVPFFFLPSAVA